MDFKGKNEIEIVVDSSEGSYIYRIDGLHCKGHFSLRATLKVFFAVFLFTLLSYKDLYVLLD